MIVSSRLLRRRRRRQMPPEVASAGHVHDGPEPRFHGGANLQEDTKEAKFVKTERNPKEKAPIVQGLKDENGLGTLENWWGDLLGISNLGPSDLRFLRTKKPARVAERNMRISRRGHISPSQSLKHAQRRTVKRRERGEEREMIEKCVGYEKGGSAVEE
ncbi:hypothetical protein DVH24_041739 [Malus domestica]|uniref:Uncharacterized protein n=1 Tax=Malus domestica TaxID=3750 RepID=A0A498IU83_MALDO|nr:hypothetical protein DVH24_041739 [Malus domestica]